MQEVEDENDPQERWYLRGEFLKEIGGKSLQNAIESAKNFGFRLQVACRDGKLQDCRGPFIWNDVLVSVVDDKIVGQKVGGVFYVQYAYFPEWMLEGDKTIAGRRLTQRDEEMRKRTHDRNTFCNKVGGMSLQQAETLSKMSGCKLQVAYEDGKQKSCSYPLIRNDVLVSVVNDKISDQVLEDGKTFVPHAEFPAWLRMGI